MRRLAAAVVFLMLATAAPVAGAEHLRFTPSVRLDTSQVIDLRSGR